jgi:hypothetical protein
MSEKRLPKYAFIESIVDNEKYPFSLGQMRNLILFRKKNGLDTILFKVGKRWLIREDLFELWIESKRAK